MVNQARYLRLHPRAHLRLNPQYFLVQNLVKIRRHFHQENPQSNLQRSHHAIHPAIPLVFLLVSRQVSPLLFPLNSQARFQVVCPLVSLQASRLLCPLVNLRAYLRLSRVTNPLHLPVANLLDFRHLVRVRNLVESLQSCQRLLQQRHRLELLPRSRRSNQAMNQLVNHLVDHLAIQLECQLFYLHRNPQAIHLQNLLVNHLDILVQYRLALQRRTHQQYLQFDLLLCQLCRHL